MGCYAFTQKIKKQLVFIKKGLKSLKFSKKAKGDFVRELLQMFDYIKRYHSDIFESLALALQFFIFKLEQKEALLEFVSLHHRRKEFRPLYEYDLKDLMGEELYTRADPNLNVGKILKTIAETPLTPEIIEQFIHTITIKRTLNKLYVYSTPQEVNELIISLLDIAPKDEVYNPCYGMGTLFLSLSKRSKTIRLFGEELDGRLAKIAKLMARVGGIQEMHLFVNDILKKPVFKNEKGFRQFDKIVCNPPFSAHLGIEYLKNDERFSRYGILAKSSPELVFLTHALMHLKQRGVFIVRNQTLQKSFLEEKLRERMVEDRVIEAIIELPKNIFPHQSHDFSILVLAAHSDSILHIDATSERFWQKDGKYNRLIGIEEILALYRQKRESEYSKLTPIEEIDIHDLRAQNYLRFCALKPQKTLSLASLKPLIFRGQRVYGGSKDVPLEYLDIGIQDFAPYCFTDHRGTLRSSGDREKILRYALKPYDILLPLRGSSPKVTLLGESYRDKLAIANAGIIVIRLPQKEKAIALYLYLFSKEGQKLVSGLYESSAASIITPENLLELALPASFEHDSSKRFATLERLAKEIASLEEEIDRIR